MPIDTHEILHSSTALIVTRAVLECEFVNYLKRTYL